MFTEYKVNLTVWIVYKPKVLKNLMFRKCQPDIYGKCVWILTSEDDVAETQSLKLTFTLGTFIECSE